MFYATLPNPPFIEMELRNWLRDTTMSINSVHHQINELKQTDLSKFKELLNNKEITKSFFDLVQKDRDCYYASLEARFSLIKSFEPIRRGVKIDDELLVNLKKIYDQYSPNDESLLFSSFWSEYATNYIENYKLFTQEDFSVQKFQDLMNSGMIYTHFSNEAKKYLSGKALELFQARHIHYACIQAQSSFEKELISLFEQFEKDYPRSEYSKYLKPYIEKIIEYYRIIDQPFDQAILFMDNYETINTLSEAIKPLQGKKIYIDVWATWCAPCIREFAHNEALKKVLAENDIQQLYISIDSNDADQKWKNAIKFHHLTGTHIRANKEFDQELRIWYSKNAENPYISIPWYMLIDENGNIMEERAKRPSQLVAGEKLW
jgi:thiol-disulfide isomerase/thioredoxin